MYDPPTGDLRAVLKVEGESVESYFDPPDHYFETIARTTLDQKLAAMSWTDFFEQLPDRVPYSAWWELVDLDADDLPSAFAELLDGSCR
jgi:hypothetical protein